MDIKADTNYKINPEFEADTTEVYVFEENSKYGKYFVRIFECGGQATELSFFNNVELQDGVLIEA